MGAIIYEGNFMVRGQLSGGQFPSGAIVRGAIFLGGNCLGAVMRGAVILGAIFLGGNCPRTPSNGPHLFYTKLSREKKNYTKYFAFAAK